MEEKEFVMKKFAVLTIVLSATALLVAGCPLAPSYAVMTLKNVSDTGATITEVRFKAPGSANFGQDMLSGSLSPGNSREFELDAPLASQDQEGVEWEVQLTYDIGGTIDVHDVGTFRCLHAGDEFTWAWEPEDEPDRCID
jgi:hypothetical protein